MLLVLIIQVSFLSCNNFGWQVNYYLILSVTEVGPLLQMINFYFPTVLRSDRALVSNEGTITPFGTFLPCKFTQCC